MTRKNLYPIAVEPRLSEIKIWAESGSTNKEIASALKVAYSTFLEYCTKYPELDTILKDARYTHVPEVRNTLLKKALGFEYTETKISKHKDDDGTVKEYVEVYKKYAQPDMRAIELYLRNYGDTILLESDQQSIELRKAELELKKIQVESNQW